MIASKEVMDKMAEFFGDKTESDLKLSSILESNIRLKTKKITPEMRTRILEATQHKINEQIVSDFYEESRSIQLAVENKRRR